MQPPSRVEPRQLWNLPTSTGVRTFQYCTPFVLPENGIVAIDPTSTLTLAAEATYVPACSTNEDVTAFDGVSISSVTELQDPFHASITPQVYATAAATCIAWMLVIMLIITPRTFYLSGPQSATGLMGRRGMISGARGGTSVIGVGSRPWLQKIAALTVAVSLTIATADTFKVAEYQYQNGYMDAIELRDKVVLSLEIRVSRIVSDVFLWLAQVQTLIRLFSRHKEKVIIKWVGFALIVLDVTFSILNSIVGRPAGRPRAFANAIPALTYLFQLALSMLYAAWVLYYASTKKRYAFYHPMMWNMSVVALLSIVAILTPVVFFITDISDMSVAGWGDYFRWVGAAAASVVVWEWVERIEVLEREEKKDGILGREVFDGDEMLDVTPSAEISWPRNRFHRFDPKGGPGGPGGGASGFASGLYGYRFGNRVHRFGRMRPQQREGVAVVPLGRLHSPYTGQKSYDSGSPRPEHPGRNNGPSPPQATPTPVSRADTMSATSTVYTVQYHPVSEGYSQVNGQTGGVPNVTEQHHHRHGDEDDGADSQEKRLSGQISRSDSDPPKDAKDIEAQFSQNNRPQARWHDKFNPFKRRRASPPVELLSGRVVEPLDSEAVSAVRQSLQEKKLEHGAQQSLHPDQLHQEQPQQPITNYSIWDWRSRLSAFAADTSDRLRDRSSARQGDNHLPVTIIPAQPRGRTWSPETLEKSAKKQQQRRSSRQQRQQQQLPPSRQQSPASAPIVVSMGTLVAVNGQAVTSNSASQNGNDAAEQRSRARSTPPQVEITSPSPESVQHSTAAGEQQQQQQLLQPQQEQRQSSPDQSLSPTTPRPKSVSARSDSSDSEHKAEAPSNSQSPPPPGGQSGT